MPDLNGIDTVPTRDLVFGQKVIDCGGCRPAITLSRIPEGLAVVPPFRMRSEVEKTNDGVGVEVSRDDVASSAVVQRYLSAHATGFTQDLDLPVAVDLAALRTWLAGPESTAALGDIVAAAHVRSC